MCAVIHKYVCIESSNLVLYPTHRINRAVTDELFIIHLHQGSSPKQTQHVLYFHELRVQNHLSREQVQSCLRHISMVTVSFNFFIYFKSFVFQPTGGLRGKISAHGGDPVTEPRPHWRLSPGAGHVRRHRNKVWPDAAQVQAFLTVTVTHGSCYRRSKLSPPPHPSLWYLFKRSGCFCQHGALCFRGVAFHRLHQCCRFLPHCWGTGNFVGVNWGGKGR